MTISVPQPAWRAPRFVWILAWSGAVLQLVTLAYFWATGVRQWARFDDDPEVGVINTLEHALPWIVGLTILTIIAALATPAVLMRSRRFAITCAAVGLLATVGVLGTFGPIYEAPSPRIGFELFPFAMFFFLLCLEAVVGAAWFASWLVARISMESPGSTQYTDPMSTWAAQKPSETTPAVPQNRAQ